MLPNVTGRYYEVLQAEFFNSLFTLFPSLLFANSMAGIGYIILWGAEIVLFLLYIIAGLFLWFLIRKSFISKLLHYFNLLLLAAGVSAAVFILVINILLLISDQGYAGHHLVLSIIFTVFLLLTGWLFISKSIKFFKMCIEKL